jgi:hypothetical protein
MPALTTIAASAPSTSLVSHPCSTHGVDALIAQATLSQEQRLLAETFSPLFPDDCPWVQLTDMPDVERKRHALRLHVLAARLAQYKADLTATAGQLSQWLDASDETVRELALAYARRQLPGLQKLGWAKRLLGHDIPGGNIVGQLARVNDARFWRRAIRTRLLREREHFYLRLGLVGQRQETYVSDQQLLTRRAQLQRQQQWMENTVLVPRYIVPGCAPETLLTLDKVASSPRTRFAKLYAFVKAMDSIAQEDGLASAMVTLTLEPAWHSNPSHGQNSWSGASPREGHRSIARRWQAILVALHKAHIGISGLRVVEPHQDGCPHWHVWLLYRPEFETRILSVLMQQFPNRLKLREPSRRGDAAHTGDRMYDTRDQLLAGPGRPLTHAREGAQVEVSKIDRSISSGASYAMKYLLKTVDGGEPLNQEADLFGDSRASDETPADTAARQNRRQAHRDTAQRVDAYRSLWGINAGQLFGVAKCLTAWDELRRLPRAPDDMRLRRLWVLARGTEAEGHIGANSGLRGDARGFLEALGGLAASGRAQRTEDRLSIGRLTEAGQNGYGEEIRRTRGVTLVERSRTQRQAWRKPNRETGEVRAMTVWRCVKTVVAQVVTRLGDWTLAPKNTEVMSRRLVEARTQAEITRDSPATLGKRAVDAFWTMWWAAVSALSPEPAPSPG